MPKRKKKKAKRKGHHDNESQDWGLAVRYNDERDEDLKDNTDDHGDYHDNLIDITTLQQEKNALEKLYLHSEPSPSR